MKEIKILSNDKQIYKVNDFILNGKDYNDAIGIIFGSPIIGLRLLAFDSWVGSWDNDEDIPIKFICESEAVQILCGLDTTKRIVESQKNSNKLTAAKWCWNYQKGNFQWYLPSLMELGALFLIRDQINNTIKQLGGDLLPTENSDNTYIWSSSKYDSIGIWSVDFSYGDFSVNYNDYNFSVRAITVFDSIGYNNLIK